MPEEINVQEVLQRLDDEDETTRYKALVAIRDAQFEWTDELARALVRLEEDPSRPVRQLARELVDRARRGELGARPSTQDIPVPLKPDSEPYPGSLLFALMSWGSGLTGILIIALSLINYFTLGRFPFPQPFTVLTTVFLAATLPYLVIGIMLLAPGKAPKTLALFYAYLSLAACVALIFGLGPAFDAYWAVQFTLADQETYRRFFKASQLLQVFLPIIAGQAMLIYYLRLALAQGQEATHAPSSANRVDSAHKGV